MELSDLLNAKHSAVLVLGMQNDYCSREGVLAKARSLDMSPIEEMTEKLGAFLEDARGSGIPIAFVQTTEDHNHMEENFKTKTVYLAKLALDLCTPGDWGYDFYGIRPKGGDKIFRSNQYDALEGKGLQQWLKASGATTVVITGVYTSRIVDTTVRSAATKGYNVFVPFDLVAMPRQLESEHYAALTIMNTLFAYIVQSGFITDVWQGKSTEKERASFLHRLVGVR